MKKIIRLTESDLTRIINKVISENIVYGYKNIKNLPVADDETIYLDDTSGELSGTVVKKIEYVKRQLKSAIEKEDWDKVKNVISFIDITMYNQTQ